MTGPEHFREAELLLEAGCEYGCPHSGCEHERGHLARARVHAALALTALAALNAAVSGALPEDDCAGWRAVVAAS